MTVADLAVYDMVDLLARIYGMDKIAALVSASCVDSEMACWRF